MDAEGIHGIVGSPEVVAGALVEVGDIDVAAHSLEGEVSVAVENGVVADLHTGLRYVLHGVLLEEGCVVGGVVAGEVTHVHSEFHSQDLGDVEDDIGVGVEADGGQGEHVLIGGGLPGDLVVPMENAEFQVLAQGGTEDLDTAWLLAHGDVVAVGGDGGPVVGVVGCEYAGEVGVF